jgi:8-oxo-dGTP pyrophosphatase MutT (NUDIX family)
MIIEEKGCGVVVVIVEEENKFLMILHAGGVDNWGFPKGHIEQGETEIETALRELGEETGIIDIEILDFPTILEEYSFEREGKQYHKINTYFIGIVKNKLIKVQETEISDYKWATYKEGLTTFVYKKEARSGVLIQAKKYLDEYRSSK